MIFKYSWIIISVQEQDSGLDFKSETNAIIIKHTVTNWIIIGHSLRCFPTGCEGLKERIRPS